MGTELDRMIRLREALRSGEARETILRAGLSTRAVAKIVGVSQPSAWCYLNGRQSPRRATALRLARLLENLQARR